MASISKPMRHGRRLFELLEEQQEPFLLDVYLLEHGYSDRALKDGATFVCWPASACRRLRRLTSYGFKRRKGAILRCVVHTIACNKLIRKALSTERTARGNAGWFSFLFDMGCRKSKNGAEFHRLSYSGVLDGDELGAEVGWSDMEEEDSKQQSPVSVFDLHSEEDSPVHSHAQEEVPSTSGLNSSAETKEAAPWGDLEELLLPDSSPISHSGSNSSDKVQFSQSHQLLLDCIHELEEKLWKSAPCSSPNKIGQVMEEEIFSWDNQRGGLTNICQLIELDFTKSRKEWSHFQPDIIEIGVEIETIIFEEIREESVMDMLCHHCTLPEL